MFRALEEEGYWHVVTYEMPGPRLARLQEFLREVAIPVAEAMKEDGDLLERRWLVRDFGKDFSYMVMSLWADPEAIWAGRTVEEELARAFPSELRRERLRGLTARVFGGVTYTSGLFREVSAPDTPLMAGTRDTAR